MELKAALRSLRSNPGFAILAVAVLALGIGANTAMFSVVNAVLLRQLDYRDPDRLVMVGNTWRDREISMAQLSEPDFDDLHDQSDVFEALALYLGGGGGDSILVNGAAEFGAVARVSPEFFRAMSVEAGMGRLFRTEEHEVNHANVAVISDAFWKRRLAGDPKAIGTVLTAWGRQFTIIGILPAGFVFPGTADVWVPRGVETRNDSRSSNNFRVVGRLKPGVSIERAQTQLSAISERLARVYPLSNQHHWFQVMGLRDQVVSNVRTTLYLLLGSVALVLLIACANVANLLLARATARTREMAVRAALGAGRWRIVRLLIVESALIAIAAAGAGLALASWGVAGLLALAPPNLPRLHEVAIDWRVLVFTLGLSVGTSLLFGLAPALEATRVDCNEALKQGGGRGSIGAKRGGLRSVLVAGEVAISVVLLAGAGLLIRTFQELTRVQPGFQPDHVLVMQANVPASTIEQARRSNAMYGEVIRRIEQIPGVRSASAALGLAGAPPRSNGGYYLEGGPGWEQLGMQSPQADFLVVTPGYFRTLEVPLRDGRDFTARDQYGADLTVIVNEALVRRSFPDTNPLGRRIRCGLDNAGFMTIVGVVADFRSSDPALPVRPAIFMPYLQHPFYATRMTFAIKTAAEPMSLAEPVRRVVQGVSIGIPMQFTTMNERVSGIMASPRFRSVLLGIFAALAVLLAMAGVYGVMAYTVGQRTGEFGLRMALGADSSVILKLVLSGGVRLSAIGLAVGLAGALAATRLLQKMLFGVTAADPGTYVAIAAVIAVAALAACTIPAWRATRVDPLEALRQE